MAVNFKGGFKVLGKELKDELRIISLLLPSRGRPHFMKRVWETAYDNAKNKDNLEIIYRLDDDDDESIKTYNNLKELYPGHVKAFIGPRGDGILSQFWNEVFSLANGEIFNHCGDDLRFRTKNWDETVINEFNKYSDRIVLVYGDDGIRKDDLATHGFLHRNWTDVLGYFLPPYFSSDNNDLWLTNIAQNVGRLNKIDIFTEHMHPSAKKHSWDKTHKERIERGKRDNVRQLYIDKQNERNDDANKLKKFIKDVESGKIKLPLKRYVDNSANRRLKRAGKIRGKKNE